MSTLLQLISLEAGGPGSGCRGSNCGRPIGAKQFQQMRQKLKRTGIDIPRKASPWDVVRTYDAWFRGQKERDRQAKLAQRMNQKARGRLSKALAKGKIGKRIQAKPNVSIAVKPVWKGRVKQQFTTPQGHQVTTLKTPGQYQKRGDTWVNKPSAYKGQFLVDLAEHRTYNDPKERNSFFIHQEAPDKGVSVEVHRNLGSLSVNVIERKLGEYGAIVDHREVSFKNVGRAMGFLNRRYGLTFKIK
jgi:hypothetical protein